MRCPVAPHLRLEVQRIAGEAPDQADWQDGDEVLVPTVTFVATSNIVIHNNMVPVFVDVETDFYEIDPTLI